MGAMISMSDELCWEVAPASWRGVVDYVDGTALKNTSLKQAFSNLPLARGIKFLSIEELECDGIRELLSILEDLEHKSPSILSHWNDPSYLSKFQKDLDELQILLHRFANDSEEKSGANKTLDTNT